MEKAITLATVLVAVFSLAGWQGSAQAAEKGKENATEGDGVEASITQLEKKYIAALLKSDVTALEEVLADDYVSISGFTGAVSTKAESINRLKSGKTKYDSIDVSDVKVRVYGPSTALFTSKAEVKGKMGDQDFGGSYRASRLYVKRRGNWQAVFFQSTKIVTPMGGR